MSSHAPAGWYPVPEGHRYWDGSDWTEHVAPRPPGQASPAAAAHRSRGPAAWFGWGGLAVSALLGGAVGGAADAVLMAALYALVVSVVALVRGRVRWARINGRAAAGAALAGALVLAGVGGAAAGPGDGASTAAAVATTDDETTSESTVSHEATPTAPPTPSPSETPTPTRTATPARTATPTPTTTPTPSPTRSAPAAGTALAALAALPVKGRAPKTGYDRDRFGQAWADTDRNGCDTRNDVLRRDLTRFTLKAGTRGCLVLTGRLEDPYTGDRIDFVRGASTSIAVQVDHVVALSDAWQKGAQQLDERTRTAFANDPLNLLAVDGPTNAAKGDGDAATWLPPRKAYRCAYVARQVAVKREYDLWVTAAERDAIERILRTCPERGLPRSTAVPLGGGKEVSPKAVAPPKPKPKPVPTPKAPSTDARYPYCKDLPSGLGPYYRGTDPEYHWYTDRDGDGVVCE
ncbi:DUF1524 domain-containing protein [Phycicoccus sp. BSK3Z-2]|uniref:DUF1524 domain-containing protein n=1 Tax=Phycicoccus avicenniae TaxID=2828860 RepID=A0A941D9J2_9MICO|nr:DUF1524 domain-containing protein [Phycicoccus avicenniae]MBR7743981.1 DUF1524 domain-containing protein [Phycicoccus avicenniae]